MTYRERREARAERLRGWAEKREAKSSAGLERARQMGEAIPFGQPILVGHYSEGRDRGYRARMVSTMDRAVVDGRKATEMASKAASIDAAAARAIYSDDADAVERLGQRLAELESKRDRIKAANAEFRKTHKAELAGLSAYGRDQLLPFPSYVLTNLSGNIKRQRDRLADLAGR